MEPLILCILPTRDRPDSFKRAVECFNAQGYNRRILLILDTSEGATNYESDKIVHGRPPDHVRSYSVGHLRNCALTIGQMSKHDFDYIAHFDDDDVSAPDRLSLQLAHIQKTGKLLTGFYDMAMYDSVNDKTWIYTNEDHRYALGTSLFYRREAWERVKFPDKTPEDNVWRKEIGLDNCESHSCFREDGSPIMVQTVHGGNASAGIYPSSARYKTPTAQQDRQIRELLNGTRVPHLRDPSHRGV